MNLPETSVDFSIVFAVLQPNPLITSNISLCVFPDPQLKIDYNDAIDY